MDVEKALETLWGRALHNMQRTHLHNLGSTEKQCLVCGEPASIKERVLQEHVFCDRRCQGSLWGVDHLLSLGMKRGMVAVKEKRRFPRLVPRLVGVEDLPDEVLWELISWAYRFRLQSVEELDELLAMRWVSRQFVRVIDHQVIPSIQFLCGDILRLITPVMLSHFTGLETMLFGAGHRDPFTQLTLSMLTDMRHLKSLALLNVDLDENGLGYAKGLERLELEWVDNVTDEQVGSLVSVRDLSIGSCEKLSHACLDTLSSLEKLRLWGKGRPLGFTSLNMCISLKELTIGPMYSMNDTSIDQLVNLTSLSIPYCCKARTIGDETLGRLPQLKILDISGNPRITHQGMSHLLNLERLSIGGNSAITMETVTLLTNLVSLDLTGRGMNFELASVQFLTRLQEIYTGGCAVRMGGQNGTQLPASLVTLDISSTVIVSTGYLLSLPLLTSLTLGQTTSLLDYDLKKLTGLRFLDLSHNSVIFDESLEALTNLTELILWDNTSISAEAVLWLGNLSYLMALDCNLRYEDVRELRARSVQVYDDLSVKGIDPFPPHFRGGDLITLM
jgi:Leucine-rich repeat (LRR) protein